MWIARQWAPGRYLQQRRADRSQQDGDTREADDRRHSVGKDESPNISSLVNLCT